MIFIVLTLLAMLSNAAHDTPPFSWDNRPQLIAFTFEGSLNASALATTVLSRSSNGRLSCSRSIPATWFATDCTSDIHTLNARNIEIAAFSDQSSTDQGTLACLRAKVAVKGLRTPSAKGAVQSNFQYSLVESASDLWPFTNGTMVSVPFSALDAVGIMAALATSYDGPRRPIVVSLSSLIRNFGLDATTMMVQEIMSLPEIVAVTAGQLSSLALAKDAPGADSIVNLCRSSTTAPTTVPSTVPNQTSTAPTTVPSTVPNQTSTKPAPGMSPAPSTSKGPNTPAPTTASEFSPQPPSSPTSVPSGSQGPIPTPTSATTSGTQTPVVIATPAPVTSSPPVPLPMSTAPTSAAPISTKAPTMSLTSRPSGDLSSVAPTTIPGPTSAAEANITLPTTTPMTTAPGKQTPPPSVIPSPSTPMATSLPDQPTSVPNVIGEVPGGSQTDTGSSSDSSSSSSSSKSTGYVPYVIGIGGGLCAMAVAIVYKVFKREDRFPPVITNGHVFDTQDREIYDLEAYNSSVRVGADSAAEGSSSFAQSDLESVSTLA